MTAASSAIDFEGSLQTTKSALTGDTEVQPAGTRLCQRHRCCCGGAFPLWREHHVRAVAVGSSWHGQEKDTGSSDAYTETARGERHPIVGDGAALHMVQNMAVALKNKVAEEDVDQGNGGLGCTLRRKHSEASERLQVVLQQYKTALGPDASFLQQEEESQMWPKQSRHQLLLLSSTNIRQNILCYQKYHP
ncbi:ATP synthase gamma chain [Dissostichus eleginoides]|uniref:ATP synthase gamma chain n=1 Tax=Dissostichus eleginoides TaxID=100907 RepID=A0AAD9C0H7_DISEL|nr:ATP synthase gamma chain [Dissostichus eleginoides]